MSSLKPTFSLTIGDLSSSSDNPVAGPQSFRVLRDMALPADALQITLMERAEIDLGAEVTLSLGYEGEEETVFTGSVARLRPGVKGVQIDGVGQMNALLNLRTSAIFENQTPGSIARDLIDQAGLEAGTIDEGPSLPAFAIDRRLSGYQHLQGLADRLGYELYTDRDGAVMFHALGDAAGLDAAGGGLLDAAAGAVGGLLGGGSEGYLFGQHLLNATGQRQPPAWGRVWVGGESPMSGQGDNTAHWLTTNDADYQGAAGSDEPTLLRRDPVARTKDLADRFAAGHLALAQRVTHQVTIRLLGRPQLDLGETLSVADVPDPLVNGEGYLRAIRHQFSAQTGFTTTVRLSMSGDA